METQYVHCEVRTGFLNIIYNKFGFISTNIISSRINLIGYDTATMRARAWRRGLVSEWECEAVVTPQ
jgi:hypothetical protein